MHLLIDTLSGLFMNQIALVRHLCIKCWLANQDRDQFYRCKLRSRDFRECTDYLYQGSMDHYGPPCNETVRDFQNFACPGLARFFFRSDRFWSVDFWSQCYHFPSFSNIGRKDSGKKVKVLWKFLWTKVW